MEFIYRNRKYAARIALVSLVFILLLVLSFKIFGGKNNKANLNKVRVNRSKVIEYCIPSDNNKQNIKSSVQIKRLVDVGFANIIISCAILSLIHFIRIYRSNLFCERRYTLVSLCVRMDE